MLRHYEYRIVLDLYFGKLPIRMMSCQETRRGIAALKQSHVKRELLRLVEAVEDRLVCDYPPKPEEDERVRQLAEDEAEYADVARSLWHAQDGIRFEFLPAETPHTLRSIKQVAPLADILFRIATRPAVKNYWR